MEGNLRGTKRGREPPPQSEGLCHFWVKKKNRYCRWPACASDAKYCANHSMTHRVPCPLDPNHTVFKSKLEQHLKVCNKTKLAQSQKSLPCYRHDANTSSMARNGSTEHEAVPTKLADFSDKDVLAVIEKVKAIVLEARADLSVKIWSGRSEEVTSLESLPATLVKSKKKMKHELQQEGILDLLEKQGYRSGEGYRKGSCFVEMGASKGGLSMALYDRVPRDKATSHVLIDRAAVKLKKDRKLEKIDNSWQRLRIDIRHLRLQSIDKVKAASEVVVLSKHLCGGMFLLLRFRCLFFPSCIHISHYNSRSSRDLLYIEMLLR